MPSGTDQKYNYFRVERRGLRRWECFEANPALLQDHLRRYSPYKKGWQPYIVPWQRYAASKRMVQDLHSLTLIHRVNVALDAAASGRLSIVRTPKHFPSWGTEVSRAEGAEETTRIAPDWMIVDGDASDPPPLNELNTTIIA
ncbi:hypothetical protein DL766_006528 [Monosporascus sp. MC13-8B]|nr:hypothetical protein DL763_007240 [Monosporascus cannonballus]RYP27069.1 hypothetical protein DL766_006528 [Monosporascus sp. MC13-8B]